jgi:ribonuclease BN (tRNA processing enzyme)
VITHEHPDHCVDLHPLFRIYRYGGPRRGKLPLYCSPGVVVRLDAVDELGRDADLFVVDATDRPGEAERSSRNLLTAREAGAWALAAGARRLMLTHFWPGNDRDAAVRDARALFAGEIVVADEERTITFA